MKLGKIDKNIGLQVHITWRAIKKILLVSVRKGGESVSPGSFSIPIVIGANPGISPQQVANALHLDATKVAFFLRKLESDGLVTRVPSETDKRKVHLYLTDKGQQFSRESIEKSDQYEKPVHSAITVEERDELIRILIKLRENL